MSPKTGKPPLPSGFDTSRISKLLARIRRTAFGNVGDYKPSKGPRGYMKCGNITVLAIGFFNTIIGQKIILLLAGSSKKDQGKAIAQAKGYLANFQERIGS